MSCLKHELFDDNIAYNPPYSLTTAQKAHIKLKNYNGVFWVCLKCGDLFTTSEID